MVHQGPILVSRVDKKIFRIDYIKNPELEKNFDDTKEEFRLLGIPTDEQVRGNSNIGEGGKYAILHSCDIPELTNPVKYANRKMGFGIVEK